MPSQPLNVLIVEDNPNDAELVLRELRRAEFEARLPRSLGELPITDWTYDLRLWRHLDTGRPEDPGP